MLASLSVLNNGHGDDILDLIDFLLTWLVFLWTSGAAVRARDTMQFTGTVAQKGMLD